MNPIFSPREYCSQHANPSSFQTLEYSVKLIEEILQKKTLCCHDVIYINEAYQTISQLANENPSTLLLNLTQKITAIKNSQASAEEIITAYHLQQLKISPLNEGANSFSLPLNLDPKKIREIATHLPFCKSGEQFEVDVKALLGKNDSSDVTALLQAKKNRFREYEERAVTLNKLREQNSSLYPSYCEEILQEGLFNLYDHLIAMKALSTKAERSAAIEKLSFSSFSKIVLEFRKAAFSKVDKILSQGSPNTVFLLGNTGSGKSTTLCYLRGDPMILEGGAYQSFTDIGHLIGNDTETSCTLFPNITVKEDLALVDFPGFADTHGEVISLAIELTLRGLVRKYSPKIVLLTSITDIEARFTHIHLLGKRLERVLGTLDNCLLGLTKYSKDPDFINIQAIEQKQKEELSSPSKEEENIIQQIFVLEPHAGTVPAIQAQVDQLKMRVLQLQKLRPSSSNQALPETEEKSKHYANLLKKEEAFKKHSGIKRVISLKDLTDQKQLSEIIQTLKEQEKTESTVLSNTLDPTDEKLLETLFTHNLKKVIEEKQKLSNPSLTSISKDISKEIEAFGQRILETSLINTLLKNTHPEIGEFLHLESMDPTIVRKYDKKVITDCINGYIDEVIASLMIAEGIIKEIKTKYPALKTHEADREWAALRSYILTLSTGISPNANPDKIKEAWESLQKAHQERLNSSKNELKLSRRMEIIVLIPFAIPYGIFSVFKNLKQKQTSREFIQQTIDELYQGITAAGGAVIALKDIENTVKKKDQFDEVFASHPLSLDSLSSLKESLYKQIDLIEKIYGKEEWNKRVKLITDQLTSDLSSIRPNAPIGETLLYTLISQKVSCKELPPYFNAHTFLAIIYSFLNSPPGSDLINSTGKYQEILKRLFPDWKFVHYKQLGLDNSSHFFHKSLVTDQEYQLLSEQSQKVLEPYNKDIISRLLFAAAISRLWKQLPLPMNGNKKPGLFNSIKDDQNKILDATQKNAWILEYSKRHLLDDKEFILNAIQKNGSALQFANEIFKNDREFILTAVKKNGSALQFANEIFKNDREFILAAVHQDGSELKYITEAFKNDQEVIFAAIQQDGRALQFANEAFKNDKAFILAAIQKNASAIKYVCEVFNNNREFTLAAIQKNASVIKYVSEVFKNDKEIILAAVQQNGLVLEFANEVFKNDKEIILAAVQHNGLALELVSEDFKNDKEIVLAAVQHNGLALEFTSKACKNDRDIALAAVQQNGLAVKFIGKDLIYDMDIALAAVRQNGLAFLRLSWATKRAETTLAAVQQNGLILQYLDWIDKTSDVTLAAVQQNGLAFQYLDWVSKTPEIALAAVEQNGLALEFVSEALKTPAIAFTAVQQNGLALEFVSEAVKTPGIALAAIQQNGSAFQFVNEPFKNNREFVLNAVKKNGYALQYLSEAFKNNQEIVLAAVRQNGLALYYVSEAFKNDKEIVLTAVSQNGLALWHASEAFKNNQETVLAAVRQNGSALWYASEALKNNREFIITAVQQNRSALQYASETLKNDQKILLAANSNFR